MAGAVAAKALRDVAGVECVAGVDPCGTDAPASDEISGSIYRDVSALGAEGPLDLVLVSCSSAQHADAIESVGELRPRRIWVEKPRVLDHSSYQRLLPVFEEVEVRTLFHRAFSPEVREVAMRLPEWRAMHDEISAIECRFEDPYARDTARRNAVADVWSDSGINAMTALGQWVALREVTGAGGWLPLTATATLALGGDSSAAAVISCEWTVRSLSKQTTITFGDGALVEVDHTGFSCTTRAADGRVLEEYRFDRQPLAERYRLMFQAYAENTPLAPSPALDNQLHMLLFDVRDRLLSS
jgi:predicted dehydrogenase